MQARHQDSVTGGAEINFGGHEKFIYVNSRGRGGTRSLFECGSNEKGEDQKKEGLQYKNFHKFWLPSQNSCKFFTNFEVKTKKKKGSSSLKFYEIRCKSTKITKKQFLLVNFRAVNTNLGVLGLDLHSSSPGPVNFFGAQSSLGGGHNFRLGGHKQSFGGGMAPECPSPWRRA